MTAMTSFRLVGLPAEPFEAFFEMSPRELEAAGARRLLAVAPNSAPCRISLVDAEVGEELLLLPWEHQPAASPYRASGPIFVRRHARQVALAVGALPPYVTRRLMSVRAYDAADMMVDAEVCEGTAASDVITRLFADDAVAYIHLHNAKRGCFSCLVERA
jgi:hypothetical protein